MPDLAASARRLYRRLLVPSEQAHAAPDPILEADGTTAIATLESWIGSAPQPGGRGGLAAAAGLASTGQRATVLLDGGALAASLDLLAAAARRRLPLVIHATTDGGHEACHGAAASGAVVLFAADVQDAVDLTLLGRRLAEDALAPVVVAMDGRETARAVQDVRLPSPEAVRCFLGNAGDVVHPPTPSQEMLFGVHRRRVPRWHDLERPLLHGAEAPAGGAARHAFFDVHLPELLARAFGDFTREFGRRPEALRTAHVEGTRYLLLAMGAAVETAEAAATALRSAGVKAGSVGLRVLSPLPAVGLLELLRGRRGVVVLERGETAALTGELRALLERGRSDDDSLPLISDREVPVTATAFYGASLRGADLVALVREMSAGAVPSPVHLGIDTAAADAAHPKRQALRDALRRAYPESAGLGVRGDDANGLVPRDALVVSVHRIGDEGDLLHDAAGLLRRLLGGHLRARPAAGAGWGVERRDVVLQAPSPFPDPGDGAAADIAVWLAGKTSAHALAERLKDDGVVLLADGARPSGLRGAKVYECRAGSVLGALIGLLRLEGRADVSLRKLLQTRRKMLEENGVDDVDARLDALQAGFESVARVAAEELAGDAPVEGEPPPVVRRLGRGATPLADLPTFWDRVRGGGVPAPDPFLATGVLPPVTSALHDLSAARSVLPAFDPGLCTGCGGCWTACPDSAVLPVAIAPDVLLGHAMERAKSRGASVDKLRMVASKLAAAVRREMAAPGWQGAPADELCDAAFAAIKLPKGHEEALREAYATVRGELAALPAARTAPFFDAADDDGEIFSLAVDPYVCKGCGLCVTACEPGALTAAADSAGRTAAARELWRFCDELPEPTEAARERARRHPDVSPLAAALTSRAARETMAGGHGAEPGSGEALALRQALGAATELLRPLRERQLQEIGDLKARLAEAIRGTLASALPGRDLDALARGLDALQRPDAELAELTAGVESAFEDERVDVARTRRLVATARAVADLEWRWTTGEGGLGRAPFGLVLATPGLDWAAAFPYQPFRVPVTAAAAGDAADVARGLAEGERREAVAAARVLRRARLELDRPAEAARASAELDRLAWSDLEDEERRLAAPLFVAVAEDDLRHGAPGGLWTLLASDLAVKVLVLQAWAAEDPSSSSLNGLVEALKKSFFFTQSSVAHSDHLAAAVASALDRDGPAFLRVLAPSPARGDFLADATLARARELVESGAFVLSESPSPPNPPLPEGEGGSIPEVRLPSPPGRGAGGEGSEVETLRREYEARLAAARAEFQVETAQRVRARLLELALRRPAVPAAPEVRE